MTVSIAFSYLYFTYKFSFVLPVAAALGLYYNDGYYYYFNVTIQSIWYKILVIKINGFQHFNLLVNVIIYVGKLSGRVYV